MNILADFFSEFAVALNQKDASKVSDYYYTPSIFVSRGTKQVCSDWQQLVKFNQQFIDQFLLKELNERTLKIVKTLKLSKKLFFCMVEWQYEDENEMVAIDTRMSFTLKKEGDSQFKIMVTVLIETVDDVNALLAV